MKTNTGFGSASLPLAVGLLISSLAYGAAVPAADGGAIFKKNCAICHGTDGKGIPTFKTPNFTDPKWQASAKDKDIREVIKNGKKGTLMQGFAGQLNDQEISALVGYIRSLKKK
jgi:cbb3-type cytochrome c oxidase subunit III